MAADRRSPVTRSGKPAARKTPANAAAVAKSVVAKAVVAKAVVAKSAVAKSAATEKPLQRAEPKTDVDTGYILEDQVGFLLRRAHQRASVIFAEVMGQYDITPTQFAALAKIEDEGSISQNHLGRLTAMDPSTILGVVGRLARQGFVHLRSTPGDARLTMIELTLDGQKRIAEMKAVAANVAKRTLSPLKPAEAKTLNELLARIG